MIPAAFEYHRPSTLQDAVALLGRLGDEAKVLAGGQSLIPLMKLRFAAPRVLVDVNRIEELEGPGIPEFGGFLLEYGFERTDQAKGCTLYMIARTVASLGRCADPASPGRAALCIGYRGQNPLLRIRERR